MKTSYTTRKFWYFELVYTIFEWKKQMPREICKLIQLRPWLNWFPLILPNIQSGMFINFQLTQLTSQDSRLQKKICFNIIKLLAPFCLACLALRPPAKANTGVSINDALHFLSHWLTARYTLDNLNLGRKNRIYLLLFMHLNSQYFLLQSFCRVYIETKIIYY